MPMNVDIELHGIEATLMIIVQAGMKYVD